MRTYVVLSLDTVIRCVMQALEGVLSLTEALPAPLFSRVFVSFFVPYRFCSSHLFVSSLKMSFHMSVTCVYFSVNCLLKKHACLSYVVL